MASLLLLDSLKLWQLIAFAFCRQLLRWLFFRSLLDPVNTAFLKYLGQFWGDRNGVIAGEWKEAFAAFALVITALILAEVEFALHVLCACCLLFAAFPGIEVFVLSRTCCHHFFLVLGCFDLLSSFVTWGLCFRFPLGMLYFVINSENMWLLCEVHWSLAWQHSLVFLANQKIMALGREAPTLQDSWWQEIFTPFGLQLPCVTGFRRDYYSDLHVVQPVRMHKVVAFVDRHQVLEYVHLSVAPHPILSSLSSGWLKQGIKEVNPPGIFSEPLQAAALPDHETVKGHWIFSLCLRVTGSSG